MNSDLSLYFSDEIIFSTVANAAISQTLINLNLVVSKSGAFFSVVKIKPGDDVLIQSQLLYETGLCKYAYPNYYLEARKCQYIPNDSYFSKQFGFHNTGQLINGTSGTNDADIDAPEAWDITKGSVNIVIAHIDEGVTSNHPDLPNARQVRLPGSNFAAIYNTTGPDIDDPCLSDPNNPCPPNYLGDGSHGDASVGLIAASQDNNEGISGLAPYCKIMPIRISFGNNPVSMYVDAINFAWQNGADVISNGWVYAGSAGIPGFEYATKVAIDSAIAFGRGGKGTLVVWPAGNGGSAEFPGSYQKNGSICVGASTKDDTRASYSPNGYPALEVVAPSSSILGYYDIDVWTMDVPANMGYNPNSNQSIILPNSGTNYLSYTGRFSGTSAAGPLVAGTAALMLSVNPTLTASEIEKIIKCTSEKVGGYNYNWSAVKPGYSNELGYGRINAHQAVLAAQIYNPSTIVSISPTSSMVCLGQSIILTATGATNYLWLPSGITTNTISVSPLITSTYLVTDVNNCVSQATATVLVNPTTSTITTIGACSTASCSGSATITSSGGTGPYTYVWNESTVQTGTTAIGLCPGSHSVTTTDANGCSTITFYSIGSIINNTITTISICSYTTCDGMANITSSGGTAPYTYVWNGVYQNGTTASGLCFGTHNVTITDANGCTAIKSYGIGLNTIVYDYFSTNTNPLTITTTTQLSDQTGDGKIMIKGPVYINVNYTITNKTWYFGNDYTLDPTHDKGIPASGIVVKPGVTLTIDNTLFTAAENCNMWAGVQVWGTPAGKKPAAIGKLVMKNLSIIQYAHTGVSCFRATPGIMKPPIENGMGILQAYGKSKFINNSVGVAFNGYTLIDNYSYINDCEFICNAPLPAALYAGAGTESFIRLSTIKSPNFRGNLFTNTYSGFALDKRGTAISSYNAAYNLTQFSGVGNTFNNLTKGINTNATGGIKNITITGNTFNNVQQGITTVGTNYDNITGNTFNIPDQTLGTLPTWGVYLNGTQGFNVSDANNFNKCATCTGISSKGVIVLDAGTFAGTVSKNNFNNLQIGSQSEGNNGNATGGLQLKCNTYTGNQYAISVSPQYPTVGYLAPQGNGCAPTAQRPANNFPDACSGSGNYKDINSTIAVTYFENNANVDKATPACVRTGATFVTLNNCNIATADNCNASGGCTNPNCLQALQNQMNNQPNILIKKQLLHELILSHIINSNGNNTEIIIKNLLEAWNTEESRKILVPMYIDMVDFVKAQSTLDQIPQNNTENINYHKLYQELILLGQAEKTILDMTSTQEQTIRQVANSSTLIKYHAQAVLEGANKEHYVRTPEQIQLSTARLAFMNNDKDETTIKQNINEPLLMDNYPNPFTESTVIPYYLPEETTSGELTVTDITGRLIQKHILVKGLNTIDLKTDNLLSGIYYYNMIIDEKLFSCKKMILMK